MKRERPAWNASFLARGPPRPLPAGGPPATRPPPAGMECFVLGWGAAVPHPRRGPAGHLLRHGGCTLLIDAGLGTLQKLAVLGVSLAAPDAVAFTPLHLDHTAELAG